MKRHYKFISYYLLVYFILLIFYGLIQKFSICVEMEGFKCNFSESKFFNFLTVVSYILTPIIAIIGFQNWKSQYKYEQNKNRFAKVFELSLLLNSQIRILRETDISIRTRNSHENISDYSQNYLDPEYEKYLEKTYNLKKLYNECLDNISILEYTQSKKMNGLRKILLQHSLIIDSCSSSFYSFLQTYETNNTLLRSALIPYFSRKNEEKIFKEIYQNPGEFEKNYRGSNNIKEINLQKRIHKYISLRQKD